MKLRILGNAIRLRLKRNEVELIASGKPVVEKTQFAGSTFIYCLTVEDGVEYSAHFSGAKMTIGLPAREAIGWAQGTEVSLRVEHETGGDSPLTLLIEKDFQCLSPDDNRSAIDDDDTFSHPLADTGGAC
ncbi:MAG: hypothetical protein AB8B96_16120 [Lysobacterales bacterium]